MATAVAATNNVPTATSVPILMALDIRFSEILEYLQKRNRLGEKWATVLKAVKVKIDEAAKELPNEPEFQAVKSQDYTITDCRNVFEALKQRDGEELNMFRMYKSNRLQIWYKLLKLYQQEGCHVGELASALIRNLTYQIPSNQREVQRLYGVIDENNSKISTARKRITEAKSKFRNDCEELGIQGNSENLEQEVRQLGDNLKEEVFDKILDLIKSDKMKKTISYFSSFINKIHFIPENEAKDRIQLLVTMNEESEEKIFELVKKLGLAPVEKTESAKDKKKSEQTATSSAGGGAGVTQVAEIDWGFGDDDDTNNASTEQKTDLSASAVDINWDFSGSVQVENQTSDEWVNVTIEGTSGEQEKVHELDMSMIEDLTSKPEKKNKETWIRSAAARAYLSNELNELKLFLEQRYIELKNEEELHSGGKADWIEYDTTEDVKEFIETITETLDVFTDSRAQHLFLILSSQKYVKRLLVSLEKHLQTVSKSEREIGHCQNQIIQAEAKITQVNAKLKEFAKLTKTLRQQVEAEISPLFENRIIHLIGAD
eukprot:c21090_g1_i1.p1 GENE.c21090_g1_i1~~c21090_g1_i1.p1  ORF type:complete len:545 (-),score=208.29 c21090_g1_i1:43-1677(-)